MRYTYEVVTTDGIFLALRYDLMIAVQTCEEFRNRWPQGVVIGKISTARSTT